MPDTNKPRDPLPPDVIARLLDAGERERVREVISQAHAVCLKDGVVNEALAIAYGTVCSLYRLVDELRADYDEAAERAETWGNANADLLNAKFLAEEEAKRLTAENARLREGIANLHDHLTDDQITTELRRQGIEITELPEVIRLARAKQRPPKEIQ